MGVRSNGRPLSFEILASDDLPSPGDPSSSRDSSPRRRKRKHRGLKKKKQNKIVDANGIKCILSGLETILGSDDESNVLSVQEIVFKDLESQRSVCETITATVVEQVQDSPSVSSIRFVELRQRNVNGRIGGSDVTDDAGSKVDLEGWRKISSN